MAHSTLLRDWQAAPGITRGLIISGDRLIQATGGEIKVWSTRTYQLLGGVQVFDRILVEVVLISGTLVACGRDALQASDRCGLDEGIRGWRGALVDSIGTLTPEDSRAEGVGVDRVGQADGAVFHLGAPIRAARGLVRAGAGRVAVVVLRGATWSVEIWQI